MLNAVLILSHNLFEGVIMRLFSISLSASLLLISSIALADPPPKTKINLSKAKSVKNIPVNAKVKNAKAITD